VFFSLFLSFNVVVLLKWLVPNHFNRLGVAGGIAGIYLPLLIVNVALFSISNHIQGKYEKSDAFLIRNYSWVSVAYVIATIVLFVVA